MEGDEIFTSIDSIWFYSSVFLQPSSKQKSNSTSGELQPREQDRTESGEMDTDDGGSPDPRCIEDEVVAAGAKRRAAAGSRELDERMEAWQEQWRQETRVVAAPARCSASSTMPAPGDGLAMKAHLRSWAHAVACSIR